MNARPGRSFLSTPRRSARIGAFPGRSDEPESRPAPPLIGLTTSVTVGASPERAYTNATYIRAVQQAGGIPVLLPPQLDLASLEALWSRLDALLLTGGGDIDPARYGEDPHSTVYEVSEARDALELTLSRRAVEDEVPVLAICRGVQVLNVALGGSLHQDIPSHVPGALPHSQKEDRTRPTHAVKVMGEGTRLGAIVGSLELDVNSMHHQAIKKLGQGLREVAWAPDGVIEGLELAGDRFVVGVQWHPEELVGHDAAARNLFAALVEAARLRVRR
jgi:putative glutamine amidotransferase